MNQIEYKGYTIKAQNNGYFIYDFGVPVCEADDIEHAKRLIDGGL